MNIPDKVRIGSMDYQIQFVDGPIIVNSHTCYGDIDYNKHVIRILKDCEDTQGKERTLLHEIVHGIRYERNFDYENNDDETITEEIARGLHQVIRDNPELFK